MFKAAWGDFLDSSESHQTWNIFFKNVLTNANTVWWVQCFCLIGCSLAPSVGAVWVSADQQWHMTALISIANSEDNLNEEERVQWHSLSCLILRLCKYNLSCTTIILSYRPQHMGKSWTVPNSPSTVPSQSGSCTFLERSHRWLLVLDSVHPHLCSWNNQWMTLYLT